MSDRLEQCKEVVEVMKRKETNMGMVEDNLGQVVNNLEEAWGNLVEEYFNVPALQVNCPNPKPLKTHLHTKNCPAGNLHHHHKAVIGVIILLISLTYWLLGLPLPCKQHQ